MPLSLGSVSWICWSMELCLFLVWQSLKTDRQHCSSRQQNSKTQSSLHTAANDRNARSFQTFCWISASRHPFFFHLALDTLKIPVHSHATEHQWRVLDFCLLISALSEVRLDSNRLSRVWPGRQALNKTGSGIQNYKDSLHTMGMHILLECFFWILLQDPHFQDFFYLVPNVLWPGIWHFKLFCA